MSGSLKLDNLFKQIDLADLEGMFPDEEKTLAFLAEEKWRDGYTCRFCGNTNYCKGKTAFARRCTRCKKEESATANTIFHHCKIPVQNALRIAYLVCQSPEISTYEISRNIHLRQMTCWKFKKKILECLEEKGRFNLIDRSYIRENTTDTELGCE
ncbi:MAG: transposase [Bacteroidota bacterium]